MFKEKLKELSKPHGFITLFLVALGITMVLSVRYLGFANDNAEKAMIFFIAYLALIYTLYLSMKREYEKRQPTKTKIVSGTSFESLNINLNKDLKKMKRETIISVQVINNKQALIVYTD